MYSSRPVRAVRAPDSNPCFPLFVRHALEAWKEISISKPAAISTSGKCLWTVTRATFSYPLSYEAEQSQTSVLFEDKLRTRSYKDDSISWRNTGETTIRVSIDPIQGSSRNFVSASAQTGSPQLGSPMVARSLSG